MGKHTHQDKEGEESAPRLVRLIGFKQLPTELQPFDKGPLIISGHWVSHSSEHKRRRRRSDFVLSAGGQEKRECRVTKFLQRADPPKGLQVRVDT